MLVEAGRFLRHAGHGHEWCDEGYCEMYFMVMIFLRRLIESA